MNMKNKGFSLPEMVLVLGVLVALMTMIFPDVATFLNYQKEKNEQLTMLQIKQAMNAYIRKCRALPPANADAAAVICNVNQDNWGEGLEYTWPPVDADGSIPLKVAIDAEIPTFAKELSSVSTLSARDIMFDAYGNARIYRTGSVDKVFRNGNMDIYYATVTSRGRDKGEDSNYADGAYNWHVDADNVTPLVEIDNYAAYSAQGDDEVVKFTDEANKLELYDERVAQIKSITEALDSFAYGMRSQDLLDAVPDSAELIYYPRSVNGGDASVYYSAVMTAMSEIDAGFTEIDPSSEESLAMMMRLIGLPESYAKDPVTGGLIDYSSNPRPGTATEAANPCAASSATEAPFPSIRISATPFDCR